MLKQFNLLNGVEINFIEFSPFMRKLQQENITKLLQQYDIWSVNYIVTMGKNKDRMKFEYDETKKSRVEEFNNEDKENFLRLRWFSMYEHYLYEEFGEYTMKNLKKDTESGFTIIFIFFNIYI